MPFTGGFDPLKLADHFTKHGATVGATTAQDYEIRADVFLGNPQRRPTTLECVRSNGDIVRFDTVTDEYGVLSATGIIRTYYVPDPAVHLQPTNLDYYYKECAK